MDQQAPNIMELASAPAVPAHDPWMNLRPFAPNARRAVANRLVALERNNPAQMAFDILRTRTANMMRVNNWTTLAITSPTAGCGKSTIALNLALSLAKERDMRVVLLDLDLRRPQIANMLGLETASSTAQFLTGEVRTENFFVKIGHNLAVGASLDRMSRPAELLRDERSLCSLKRLRHLLRPRILILDMPPMLLTDDVTGLLPHVDCAMLVVGAEQSKLADIDICEDELAAESKLLGVVLNKCRYTSEQYTNYLS